jgi:hypothetical protein
MKSPSFIYLKLRFSRLALSTCVLRRLSTTETNHGKKSNKIHHENLGACAHALTLVAFGPFELGAWLCACAVPSKVRALPYFPSTKVGP